MRKATFIKMKIINICDKMFEDDFNSPNMGDYSYGDNDSTQNNFKKFMPLIIIGIIGIIALIFVMMFFGSQKEININIGELGGGTLTTRPTLNISTTGNMSVYSESGLNHTTVLMVGDYSYSIVAFGYKTKRGNFTVEHDGKLTGLPIGNKIELEKDIDVTIQLIQKFDKIFDGQTLTGKILLNSQSELNNQKIKVSDSSNLLEITLGEDIVTMQGGTKTIDFSVKVKNSVTTQRDARISFELLGTIIRESFNVTIHPTVSISDLRETNSARESSKTISNEKLESGKETTISLAFRNNNRNINIQNLQLTIIPDSGFDNIDWDISLTNNGLINSIEANQTGTIQIKINIPITANLGDNFKGKLVLKSDSISEEKEYFLNFEVSTVPIINFKLNKYSFRTNCDTISCQTIRTVAEGLRLENTGNTKVENINIELDNSITDECDNWFDIRRETIDEINAKGHATIDIDITPIGITQTKTTACYLKISYNDPTKTQRQFFITDPPITINTTYRE
jgi:hypothetical protein